MGEKKKDTSWEKRVSSSQLLHKNLALASKPSWYALKKIQWHHRPAPLGRGEAITIQRWKQTTKNQKVILESISPPDNQTVGIKTSWKPPGNENVLPWWQLDFFFLFFFLNYKTSVPFQFFYFPNNTFHSSFGLKKLLWVFIEQEIQT